MTERYDLLSPRERKNSEKPYWHKVGAAFKTDRGFMLVFDSLPLPDKEGQVKLNMWLSRAKEPPFQEALKEATVGGQAVLDIDDDSIPF